MEVEEEAPDERDAETIAKDEERDEMIADLFSQCACFFCSASPVLVSCLHAAPLRLSLTPSRGARARPATPPSGLRRRPERRRPDLSRRGDRGAPH